LVYPALLLVMATTIVSYLVSAVIPKFATLYKDLNVPLPGPTRFLLALTVDYRYLFLSCVAALVLFVVGVFFWSRTEEGGMTFDRLKFRLPVIGNTLLKFQMAQFSRTLATLLTGGTPLVAGLQTASDAISSRLVRSAVIEATQMVREGESLHHALASKQVVPSLALDMIEVGESSGSLAPMLTSVAEFYEDEVSLRLSALVSFIEPAILVIMGALVAFILISLYLPIFSFSASGVAS
jgi:type IV pilus assembly protein PilC